MALGLRELKFCIEVPFMMNDEGIRMDFVNFLEQGFLIFFILRLSLHIVLYDALACKTKFLCVALDMFVGNPRVLFRDDPGCHDAQFWYLTLS